MDVASTAELVAALALEPAPIEIRLRQGEYLLHEPIVVPDGVSLRGTGIMLVDESGLPSGFERGTETTLRVAAAFQGDVVRLGNGSGLYGLRVVDRRDDPAEPVRRAGNVVAVVSRAARDVVAATVRDCELVNPHPTGVMEEGPSGHALMVATRNPGLANAPAPHEAATVEVRVERSVIRATGLGGGIFVINFASHGAVTVVLARNRIEGRMAAAGGVSRPDAVTGAVAKIESTHNLFTRVEGGLDAFGWQIYGSSSPHIAGLLAPGAVFNTLHVRSVDDTIEGFRLGILAAAGRRTLGSSDFSSDNAVDLELHGLTIRSVGPGAADLSLQAVLAEPDAATGSREYKVGDRNVLRATLRNVRGSAGTSVFAVATGPSRAENLGVGNRLQVAGDQAEFVRFNPAYRPVPDAAYFEHPPHD